MLGALLVWVAHHLPAIAEKDASDQHIDEILRAFFEKWEAEDRGVGRFQSIIGRHWALIGKSPKQEDHPKHVCGAKSKTEV